MINLLLLLLLLPAGPDKATQAFAAGRFAEAQKYFSTALAQGNAPAGPLLYNLGNCAYRQKQYAQAVLYYRRAQLRLPRDQQVRFNRQLAEQSLGIEARDKESFGAAALALIDALTPMELLILTGSLQAFALVGLVIFRRHRVRRRALIFLAFLALAGAGRLVQNRWFPGPPTGIVLAPEIDVRPAPHGGVKTALQLRAGAQVQVIEYSDKWVRIVHEQGRGWTQRLHIGIVE